MIELPTIHKSLLEQVHELPYRPQPHSESPDSLAGEHLLFGWNTVAPGHMVRFALEGNELVADAFDMDGRTRERVRGPYPKLLAAASALEAADWYRHERLAPGWMQDGLYQYDPSRARRGGDRFSPYVAITILSPTGEEMLLVRRGYLHHEPYYSGRLSLVYDRLTLIEMERAWHWSMVGGAEVAAVRTLCAHIAPTDILDEMLECLQSGAGISRQPQPAVRRASPLNRCFLGGVEGAPEAMRYRLFNVRATSDQQWRRWVERLAVGIDPARASFVVGTRADLLASAQNDTREQSLQEGRLAPNGHRVDTDVIPSAWRFPNWRSETFAEQLAAFHEARREAYETGKLQLDGRGRFDLVGAQAWIIEHICAPV